MKSSESVIVTAMLPHRQWPLREVEKVEGGCCLGSPVRSGIVVGGLHGWSEKWIRDVFPNELKMMVRLDKSRMFQISVVCRDVLRSNRLKGRVAVSQIPRMYSDSLTDVDEG